MNCPNIIENNCIVHQLCVINTSTHLIAKKFKKSFYIGNMESGIDNIFLFSLDFMASFDAEVKK